MKNRILSLVICLCLMIGVTPIVHANTNTDYKTIYLDYAKDADTNNDHKLSDGISGFILLDLNRDKTPELLAFSTTTSHFDEDGNQLYSSDEGYDNPAYMDDTHTIERAFSIINGEVIEDTPWKQGMFSQTILMPFLPDEFVTDTEEFCTMVQYRGQEDYFVMNEISNRGNLFTALWYNEDGFGFSREGFDEYFYDTYYPIDFPVSSVQYYDDVNKQHLTPSEALAILLDKYENAVNASNNDIQNKVSDWAAAEVAEAKDLNLIPPEMLNDDFTEDITRAEFAAIAVQLHQAIVGKELNWHGGYIIDIDDNKYEMYIRGAYNFGITSGTGEKDGGVIFSPDLDITREQLATMLSRVVKLNKFEDWYPGSDSDFPLDISDTNKFSDDYEISDFARESVYYMSKHGIIKGVDSTRFAPLDTATKEQAILLALRIYNSFDKLPVETAEGQTQLKINYDVIERFENTTVGELVLGFEERKYTLAQLLNELNVDSSGDLCLDELGTIDVESFEWNGYTITIQCSNEEALSYKDLDKYPTYVESDDPVTIVSEKIKKLSLSDTELILQAGGDHGALYANTHTSSEYKITWISSNEDVVILYEKGNYIFGDCVIIVPQEPGTTYITAQAEEGNTVLQAQCKVVVEGDSSAGEDDDEEDTPSTTRPTVNTGSTNTEDEGTSSRPERPVIDTTGGSDEDTTSTTRPTVDTGSTNTENEGTSSRPERPVVDTTGGSDEDDTASTTRPTVDTGSTNDENEGASSRPARPVVDTTGGSDDDITSSKPTRPVVDTTEDSDETDSTSSQTPTRPTVNTYDEDESEGSSGQRPSRPVVG